ncbi:MAG: hypothetical protein ACYDHE_11270 [Candidatus Acidiferrales bacterium]
MPLDDQVTILIPTSPIPRHPSTDLIERCLASIRVYFPTAHCIIMVDGLRPQVEHRREQYTEYKKNLSQLVSAGKLGNTKLSVYANHSQQATMTRNVLHHHVNTPLILFVEHDAVFRDEPPINFPVIFDLLLSGQANLVRFYGWTDIWHEHEYLMRGELNYKGARFVKTVQYSQWPLVSRTDYHRNLINKHIQAGQITMIEPAVYYQVARAPWEENKLVVYLDGGLAFAHVDGRLDEMTGIKDPAEW